MKQFAIIGLGRFGSSLAKTLYNMKHEVLAIDTSKEIVQSMMDEVTHCVEADATDVETLKALGIRNFDAVVVSIGHDMQASILVTVLLKELNVSYVVAKANNELHGKVLEKVGADKVVYPERDMGARLAHNLVASNIMDFIDISSEYSIMEIIAGDYLSGKTLGELDLRARFEISVMAIKKGEDINVAPGASDQVERGDILIALGKQESLREIANE